MTLIEERIRELGKCLHGKCSTLHLLVWFQTFFVSYILWTNLLSNFESKLFPSNCRLVAIWLA